MTKKVKEVRKKEGLYFYDDVMFEIPRAIYSLLFLVLLHVAYSVSRCHDYECCVSQCDQIEIVGDREGSSLILPGLARNTIDLFEKR